MTMKKKERYPIYSWVSHNLNDKSVGGVFIILDIWIGKYWVGNKSVILSFEFGRWRLIDLSMAIESFIPVDPLIDNRELFLSKELFKTLCGYSISN